MTEQPPDDPADHAEDFSRRYAVELEYHAAQTMLDLGIPVEKIGAPDAEHGIRHAAFHPHGRVGGDVTPDGRIVIDSGVTNPELLTPVYGDEAGRVWAETPLRPRMEAIVAHEQAEHEAGGHEEALAAGADTKLPVSHAAREVLRAMQRGWRR